MDIKRNFLRGIMDKDSDERLVQPGTMRNAENIRISNSEGSDVGAIENSLGNKKLTNINFGPNPRTITPQPLTDESTDRIYWMVKSDTGCYVVEWDNLSQSYSFVLKDTRPENENVLGFNEEFLITAINIIVDTDNDNRFLCWNDNNKPPRCVNIERAKTYGENNFEDKHISLVKAPPLDPPITEPLNTASNQENFIKEKMLQIAYRFKFIDGEYSATSPFTVEAFKPKSFRYDFNTSTNKSMVNSYNAINITFNTGDELVEEIDILFKESGENNIYVAETFNKKFKGWDDNENVSFQFFNNKIFKTLPEKELGRLFDNVPLKALAQDVISNRLAFGNYTENYDIKDCKGNKIHPDYSLSFISKEVVGPSGTCKSNRDYEAVIAYGDNYGRLTTGLKSEGNSVHIPIGNSNLKNLLKLDIRHKAPCFAKFYRVYVKESKTDYNLIVPTLFFKQGNYTYFYIQPSEAQKVKENDFIIIKADTEGIKNKVIKVKVLEIAQKNENFISGDNPENGGEPGGYYIKTSLTGEDVLFDPDSYNYSELTDYHKADSGRDRYDTASEQADHTFTIFKGLTLDDLTPTVQYTLGEDLRYEVEILTTNGTEDTFRWRTQSKDGSYSNWNDNQGNGIAITGLSQQLDADVSITFGNTTGHSIEDKWLIKKNIGEKFDEYYRSYPFMGYDQNIPIGSLITLKYYSKKQKSEDVDQFLLELIANDSYENFEEWFYGDEIYNVLNEQNNFDPDYTNIWFRNVNIVNSDQVRGIASLDIQPDGKYSGMIIESRRKSSSRKVYSDVYVEVRKLDELPLFETESIDLASDIYYEVGRTFYIDENRNHLGFDSDDVDQTNSNNAELILPVINAFSWGNGFESYKIKDLINSKPLKLNSRPIGVIEDYKQNHRQSSITYGGIFEQSTNYNALNEFNLSTANYKDFDDKYGPIQRIVAKDGDLILFQEDKVSKVLYNKSVIYDADGGSTVRQTNEVLGSQVYYTYEGGISKDPAALVKRGNQIWFPDAKRGLWLRLSLNGIVPISSFGMIDWFRDYFTANQYAKKIASFDPYFNEVVITLGTQPQLPTLVMNCNQEIFKSDQTEPFSYILKLNELSGDVVINFDIEGTAILQAEFNGQNYNTGEVNGVGNLTFDRDTLDKDEVIVTITPVSETISYNIKNSCPTGISMKLALVIINDKGDKNQTMTSRFKWDNSTFFSEVPIFKENEITLFEIIEGKQGEGKFPLPGANIEIQAVKDYINTGGFDEEAANELMYLISSTEYNEYQIENLIASATSLDITTQNKGSVPEINKSSFIFNPNSQNDILYLIWNYKSLSINRNTHIYIYFDSSGSMDDTLAPLQTMKDTLLKDALLPLYDNDDNLYSSRVTIISQSNERTLDMLNINGNTPQGNVISLVFQDESSPYGTGGNTFSDTDPRMADYDTDLAIFRNRLESFTPAYYRGVVFQVTGNNAFPLFLDAVRNGTGNYSGTNGLSDRNELNYKLNITDGGTPQYYLNLITEALRELGYNL
jgi:hypothetical protein